MTLSDTDETDVIELRGTERSILPRESDIVAAAQGAVPRVAWSKRFFPCGSRSYTAALNTPAIPLLVGHYHDDIIVGAERFLDGWLDRRLTRRNEMALYAKRSAKPM